MSPRQVAVIGAGVVGAITAVEALRAGHQVIVVEPDTPGGEQAASYGNGCWLSSHSVIPPAEPGVWRKVPRYVLDPLGPLAIRWTHLPRVAPWLVRYLASGWTEAQVLATAHALRSLLQGGPALHATLAREAGVPRLIDCDGVMHVFRDRAAFEADALGWRVRRAVGVDWRELEREELRRWEPDLDDAYGFAVLVEEAGHCRDPGAYVAALVDLARARGARVVRARATGLRLSGGRLDAVLTDAGEVACDAAVICAGIHSKPLARAAGDVVPLEAERGYHASIVGIGADGPAPRTPMMFGDRKMVAVRTDGGLRAAGQVEFAGLGAAPDWRRADILRDHLQALFPALPRDLPADRVRRWMGNRPSMPDGRPCIGRSSRSADVIYAFGHGHIGLVGSARTGRVVAQLLSGVAPEVDLAPFDPRRFG